jgi:hypothetical protein
MNKKYFIFIIPAFLYFVAFWALITGLQDLDYQSKLSARAVEVEATITNHFNLIDKRTGTRRNTYYAVARYTTPQGEAAEGMFIIGRNDSNYPVGQTYHLYHDPLNPTQLYIDVKYFDNSVFAQFGIWFFLGLVMTGLAILLLKQSKTGNFQLRISGKKSKLM